jgi:aspartyl/asparaginyl beta-hydroxylase (cupin superfamily)
MGRHSARLRAFFDGVGDPPRGPQPADPRQRPARFFPGLTARPFHDPRAYPFTLELERAWTVVRDEMLALFRADRFVMIDSHRSLVPEGSWTRLPLLNYGHRYDAICRALPRTSALVEAIEGAGDPGLAYVSALLPRTRVAPHCGPTNTRIRCHLPLLVPRGCTLTVGGERRSWRTGRCLLFDDSFEHRVDNPSDRPRIVLVVDVWHPELTTAERAVLRRHFHGPGGLRPRPEAMMATTMPSHAIGALGAFAHVEPGSE